MVFQSFNLFPHMTVLRNITAAPIRVKGVPAEAEARARELLARVGLAGQGGRATRCGCPAGSSSGSRSRAHSRCEPKVMLFDEMTSALDPELVGEVLGVDAPTGRRGRHDDGGRHARDAVRARCRRTASCSWMMGAIVEQGAPKELFANPSTERLRAFLSRFREAYLL